jgi:hypothetical protein
MKLLNLLTSFTVYKKYSKINENGGSIKIKVFPKSIKTNRKYHIKRKIILSS